MKCSGAMLYCLPVLPSNLCTVVGHAPVMYVEA